VAIIDSSGNVGIGTTAPNRAIIEVAGMVGNTNAILGSDRQGIGIINNWPGIGFNMYWSGGSKSISTGYTGSLWVSPGDGHFEMRLGQTNAGAPDTAVTENTVLTVLNNGNVGIGTTTPGYKLDVAGALRLQPSGAPTGANGVIYYDSTADKFKCYEGGAWKDCISAGAIGGSGTTNYLAKWTGSTTLGNSIIYDNGTNVGIGTTAPDSRLSVRGAATAPIQTWQKSDGTTVAIIDATGNVGIGTTAPRAKLSVHGTRSSTISTTTAAANIGGDDVFLYINAMNSSPWGVWMQVLNDAGTAFPLVLNPSGGNVGIGTTAPGAKLHVASGLIETGTRGVKQGLSFVDSCGTTRVTSVHNGIWAPDYSGGCGDEWFIGAQDRDGGEASTLVIGMWNDANDHIALIPSGNVGIGTTNPVTKLHVANADGGLNPPNQFVRLIRSGNNPDIYGQNLAYSYGWNLGLADKFYLAKYDGAYRDYLVVDSNGNVGIGTTGPTAKLDVNGDIKRRGSQLRVVELVRLDWPGGNTCVNVVQQLINRGYSQCMYVQSPGSGYCNWASNPDCSDVGGCEPSLWQKDDIWAMRIRYAYYRTPDCCPDQAPYFVCVRD
jgi:hypothetical protein